MGGGKVTLYNIPYYLANMPPPPPPIVLVLLSVKTLTVTSNLCDVYKKYYTMQLFMFVVISVGMLS